MPLDAQRMIKAVGAMLAEHEDATLKAIEDVRGEVTAQIAALPAPEPGPPGRDGEDGEHGLDWVLAAPATVDPDQRCDRNDIIQHRHGVWQAIRKTSGDPDTDPSGWKCIVPGVDEITFEQSYAERRITLRVTSSDGHARETSFRMPSTYLPHDWRQRGYGIIAGDILRDGECDYVALCDFPGNPMEPDTAANWERLSVIGRRGKAGAPGRPGDPGEPGPGLEGLTLIRDAEGGLALLPEYADPRVQANPISIDLMTEPAEPGRRAIVGFAGLYHAAKTYGRGDVVSASFTDGPGLWLSLKPDNRAALNDTGAWERMI